MAAPPSTASPVSWNPAVPPPPVTGAGGYEVYKGAGDGLVKGEGLWLADADGLGEPLVLSLAGLSEVLALVVLVAPLAVGKYTDAGVVLDPEQAASATQTRMVMRPQPAAASLTRCAVHAMAVRVLIEPPHALGNHHFPLADRRNRRRKGNTWPSFGR